MKPKPLLLQAVTTADRHQAVTAACDSLATHSGWVVDAHFYSNKAATIRFTIPIVTLTNWLDDLRKAGLCVDEPAPPAQGTAEEISGSLAITFIHDEPDLAREIPSIPG
ncbi:hypothetical protein [Ferrovibrio terrae]|uniref:hypothetical protein n=1 Tax=Ferrovibrio terrae TaxID=2594003 RepID=UPI003137F338